MYFSCHVNPETEWRPRSSLCQKGREDHGANDTLFGYQHLRNIDGAWNNITKLFYNYQNQPKCPHCGHSEYLYCDTKADPNFPGGICLTRTKDSCDDEDGMENINEKKLNFTPFQSQSHDMAERMKGMSGDGRSRDMSLEDSFKVLQSEIGNQDCLSSNYFSNFKFTNIFPPKL